MSLRSVNLVNLSFGLRPKTSLQIKLFGLSKRRSQNVKWRSVHVLRCVHVVSPAFILQNFSSRWKCLSRLSPCATTAFLNSSNLHEFTFLDNYEHNPVPPWRFGVNLGIWMFIIQWIMSFLSDRTQATKLGFYLSTQLSGQSCKALLLDQYS